MDKETEDKKYMQRAIDLAKLGMGNHAPNPRVGAVIVHQNKIIGEGFHEQYGEGHAEVNAVASVSEGDQSLLSSATIYVTLEPCFHYGKTPPCVNLILKHKIPRVVIACKDTSKKVGGKSIQKLKEAGVEVIVGVLEAEARHLARRFLTTIHMKRPYVILKFAQSADGYIGRIGEEVAISNAICKRLVHQWRVEEAAIMVGTNTALVDNPQLNTRHYPGTNPVRVVLDRTGKLNEGLHLLDGTQQTFIFTEKKVTKVLPQTTWITVDFDQNVLATILADLHERGVQSLLVEGGAVLLNAFLKEGLWDEGRVITSPIKLKEGITAPILPLTMKEKSITLGTHQCTFYYQNGYCLTKEKSSQ